MTLYGYKAGVVHENLILSIAQGAILKNNGRLIYLYHLHDFPLITLDYFGKINSTVP